MISGHNLDQKFGSFAVRLKILPKQAARNVMKRNYESKINKTGLIRR